MKIRGSVVSSGFVFSHPPEDIKTIHVYILRIAKTRTAFRRSGAYGAPIFREIIYPKKCYPCLGTRVRRFCSSSEAHNFCRKPVFIGMRYFYRAFRGSGHYSRLGYDPTRSVSCEGQLTRPRLTRVISNYLLTRPARFRPPPHPIRGSDHDPRKALGVHSCAAVPWPNKAQETRTVL